MIPIQAAKDEKIVLVETPYGRLEFCNNELSIISTVNDPPKIRGAAPAGNAMLCVSGNELRIDGNQLEKILLILKNDPNEGYDFFQQLAGTSDDAGMKRIMSLATNGLVLRVPSHVGGDAPDRFTSANGRFVTVMQGDGNFVTYDTAKGAVGQPSAAIWSSFGGVIG